METKNKNPASSFDKQQNYLIEFFLAAHHLSNVYRQGWLNRRIPKKKCEDVAGHSYQTTLMAYIIAIELRPDLDARKVLELSIFHDLPEVVTGDITPKDNITLEHKTSMEFAALNGLVSKMRKKEVYLSINREYIEGKTPEAIFVKQIDKLQTALQAAIYEKQGRRRLDDFFPYVAERIKDPALQDILRGVLALRA